VEGPKSSVKRRKVALQACACMFVRVYMCVRACVSAHAFVCVCVGG